MAFSCKVTGGYTMNSAEALNNATEIYNILYGKGWTLEAVCGLLGNIQSESGYNPWRWQSDSVLYSDSPNINVQSGHAYGLCQWDPAAKYINGGRNYSGYAPNFADISGAVTDGRAQMLFLDENADYYPTASYPLSYAQYKAATINDYSIDYLTRAWFYNFERGTWDSGRVTAAEYWYTTLGGVTPHGNIPIWLMFKLKERR